MKKSFIAILIFYITFHFLIPEIYYLFFEETHIYSAIVDKAASNKAFFINMFSIVGTIGLILAFPFKDNKIQPVIKSLAASELYYFSILYGLLYLLVSGGFKGILSGVLSGSLYNYINLFLNPMVLLTCALFLQVKRVNIFIMVLLYLIVVTISGSRSGIIGVLLLFLSGLGFYNFYTYKNKLKMILYFFLLLSPFIFIFATQLRYGSSGLEFQTLFSKIIGRVSLIETSMIPVHFKDLNDIHLKLFYEKYGIINQLKVIIDSTIPGEIFNNDVFPNQYYRAIFLGRPETFVVENYMSINMSLPVFFYLCYGYWGIPITILFLFLFFYFMYKYRTNAYNNILFLPLLYQMLIYFDWVMVFNQLFTTVLTLIALFGYIAFRNSLVTKTLEKKNAD
ncbi:MAG: hypothetical protein V4608_01285 [Bacteroidota bacterium]